MSCQLCRCCCLLEPLWCPSQKARANTPTARIHPPKPPSRLPEQWPLTAARRGKSQHEASATITVASFKCSTTVVSDTHPHQHEWTRLRRSQAPENAPRTLLPASPPHLYVSDCWRRFLLQLLLPQARHTTAEKERGSKNKKPAYQPVHFSIRLHIHVYRA